MATIKDVAREAGLAVGTVSRVLNNRGYISDDARRKVQEAMERLNYVPNEMARSLQRKSSNIIGLIVPHIEHPYFSRLISELVAQADQAGRGILLLNSAGMVNKEKEYLELCKSTPVAGIILCSGDIDPCAAAGYDIPIVNIERKKESGCPSLVCDNYGGGQMATEYLIQKGCRNLVHIQGVTGADMPADLRGRGFLDTCERYGVKGRIISVSLSSYLMTDARTFLDEMFLQNMQIDGVFASNDIIAAQTIQVCNAHRRRIPQDIKIIGFDDAGIAEWTSPKLTTIRQPYRELARVAIDLLINKDRESDLAGEIVLPVELIVRGTA